MVDSRSERPCTASDSLPTWNNKRCTCIHLRVSSGQVGSSQTKSWKRRVDQLHPRECTHARPTSTDPPMHPFCLNLCRLLTDRQTSKTI